MATQVSDRLARISAVQFATMVTAGYFALDIFYFPRPVIAIAGRQGVWAIILDGLITYGFMRLLFAVNRRIPNETLPAFAPKLLTKPVGYLLALYMVSYHILLALAAGVSFSFVLKEFFLPHTPTWMVMGTLTATSAYMAWAGVAGLARTLQAGYTPIIILSLLTALAAGSLIRHPILLLPPASLTLLPVFSAAWHQYIIFIGFELSVTLYPFVRNEQRVAAERYTYIALAAVVAILLIAYEVIMATFGPAYVPLLRWPLVSLMRILSVQGFFIDKFGLLVVALWTIVVAGFIAVRLWCAAHDMMTLFHVDTTTAYQRILLGAGMFVIAGSAFFPNDHVAQVFAERYLLPVGVIYLVTVPALLIPVIHLRRRLVTEIRRGPL